MTKHLIFFINSILLTLFTILILSLPRLVFLTTVIFLFLLPFLHPFLFLPLNAAYSTLLGSRKVTGVIFLMTFLGRTIASRAVVLTGLPEGWLMSPPQWWRHISSPLTTKTFSPTNPWFDHTCPFVIQARERTHLSYKNSLSELSLNIFRSARIHCAIQIRRAKPAFYKQSVKKLTSSPTDKCFWSLAKKLSNNICNSTFPHLITSDGSIACSPKKQSQPF